MDLKRDENSSALLNTSSLALEAYKIERDAKMSMIDSINTIKRDVKDIKYLLTQILSGDTNGYNYNKSG